MDLDKNIEDSIFKEEIQNIEAEIYQDSGKSREDLIYQIEKYHEYFKDKIKDSKIKKPNNKTLEKWSILQLQDHLDSVKESVSVKNSVAFVKMAITAGASAVETVTESAIMKRMMPGIKLQNYSNNVSRNLDNDESLNDIVKEIIIKYKLDVGGQAEPEVRLGFKMLQIAFITNKMNTDPNFNKKVEEIAKKEDIDISKYEDI